MGESFINYITHEGAFFRILAVLIFATEIIYLMFAFIMTRSIALMNKSVKTKAAPVFALIGWAHLAATVVVVVISWILFFR